MSKDMDTPQMIKQPHGGALLSGGIKGHRGGGGRPRKDAPPKDQKHTARHVATAISIAARDLGLSNLAVGQLNNRVRDILEREGVAAAYFRVAKCELPDI